MASLASFMARSACSPGLSPKTPEQPASRREESKITTENARRFIMCCMSERSLPPFGIPGPRSVPGAIKRAVGHLFGRPRHRAPEPAPEPASDPAVLSSVGSVAGRYAGEHATLIERAERFAAKARRLEEARTPSQSANNP